MSSYYSQRVQYKGKGKHLQHQQSSTSSVNGGVHSDNDDVKYTPPKKMAALNNSFIVQKAGSSTSTYVTSDYNAGNSTVKYDLQSTPSKISTHLLDHGYGATPQPTYTPNGDETGFKGYTKSADCGITNYYKVRIIIT